MIDIKDLMIGNYLYVAGLQGHKFCMRVQAVDYRKNKVLVDGDTNWYTLDKLLPVEIVGIWLGTFLEMHDCKNGDVEYEKWFDDGAIWLRVYAVREDKQKWNATAMTFSANGNLINQGIFILGHRHELQNFFRIHTGKDLI